MQVSAPDRRELRRLAELRVERPVVLSLYLDLRPTEFATPPARQTAVRSLLDDAARRIEQVEGLAHGDRRDLRRSLERAGEYLRGVVSGAEGARGLAVFACEPTSLFESLKLPRPVESRVVIDRSPHVEPLVGMASSDDWCVLLVTRRTARLLRGSADRLDEVERFADDVHGQHDQGGWSQARYERSVDKEAADHLKRVAEVVFHHFERRACDHLVVGGPEELVPDMEAKLHPYVRERLAGRVDVDVEHTGTDEVRAATSALIEEHERRREREALDRLAEGVAAGGRAASGLEGVLGALNEHRVEALLLDGRFASPGVVCRQCGWMGPATTERCPADGSALDAKDDITEAAVERALRQSAEVWRVRHHDDLQRHGGIGALLRF
jgi:peptide chain release factor subunit 1